MKEFIDKLIGGLEELKDIDVCEFAECTSEDCADCIQRNLPNKAITIVNNLAEEYNHCTLCYLQSPCEYQNENVILPNELLADENGWIPCSERLPEKKGNYLVCSKGIIWVANYFNFTWWGIEKKTRWSDIEAWMPLPAPYTEGE